MRFIFDFVSGLIRLDNKDVVIEATNDGVIEFGDRFDGDISTDLGIRNENSSIADYGNRI
jgi:hypothetical protein